MNKDFPRIITFLRKERGITQKQAAADLEISQAVLSHYEKGVRECGLDFLVKAAEYYEVSTDYLLGRTVQRVPSSVSDLPDSDEFRHLKGNMVNQINRRLLTNTTTIIYDLLTQMGSKRLTNTVSNYLMCAEYMAFRMIYGADANNPANLFTLDGSRFAHQTAASMLLDTEHAAAVLEQEQLSLSLSPDLLSGYFEKGASSLFNLIQFAERNVKSNLSNS